MQSQAGTDQVAFLQDDVEDPDQVQVDAVEAHRSLWLAGCTGFIVPMPAFLASQRSSG
jgi:hypothetical protein